MKYFIKIWPDKTATLVTNHGKTLMVFESFEEAQHMLRKMTTKPTPFDIPQNTPLSTHRLPAA
jgi:hypothetical protein